MQILLSVALLGALASLSYAAPTNSTQPLAKRISGRASWYHVGLGACGQWNNPGDFIVALNSVQFHPNGESQWPSSQCNRPIRITHNGKSVNAVVMDECPNIDGNGCYEGYLDLSFGLFQQWYPDPYQQGIFWMDWEFTDGQGGGGGGWTPPPPPPSSSEPPYTPPPSSAPPPSSTWTPTPTSTSSSTPTPSSSTTQHSSSSSTGDVSAQGATETTTSGHKGLDGINLAANQMINLLRIAKGV
ncbi:SubName: Full=Related to B2-aldehyde-forming enzyme {ECO:0000313/EMBL:CCA67113.1} [Serendipita indica DSM 11827]|nr:SubName: Full=Related to B2-aldehyde-forming enzyme {ECO:0000313/EMBL:CCA67113.1} [Serendipita indica DSM 11827]